MKKFGTLPRSFYAPAASEVAQLLLGHLLIRATRSGPVGGIIVETEAYVRGDAACHAAPGLTRRNSVMFGEPGRAYVYFIYGCHFCVNVVCQPEAIAEAVLIRAIQPVLGEAIMRRRRKGVRPLELTNGPGKLCEAMSIDRGLNGVDLCDAGSELFVGKNSERDTTLKELGPVVTTTRIGITKAATLPLRFYLEGSAFVSRKFVE